MKKLILLIIIFLAAGNLYSQDYQVKITYTESEHSKDSHSKTVSISVNGLDAVRSTTNSGSGGKLEMSENVKLGKADFDRIQMLAAELKGIESIVSTSQKPVNEKTVSIDIRIIIKEDVLHYAFAGTAAEADGAVSYMKLKNFYKEVDGLLDCHIE